MFPDMFPELLKSIAGSVTRFILTGVATYLVNKGVIKGEDSEKLILGAGLGLATLAWSLWQKYGANLKLKIGLALPANSTLQDVEREAKLRGNGVSVLSLGLVLFLIPASIFTSACNEDQVKAVATNIDRLAGLISDARDIRDELFTLNAIDRDTALKMTQGLQRVNTALKVFNNKARTYQATGQLTPEAKADLRKLAKDISDAVTELVTNGTVGIKNPDQQNRVNATVVAIREVTLALVDAVELLKTKPAPVQKSGLDPVSGAALLILAIRKLIGQVNKERARSGMTPQEIFESAGVQLQENEAALLADAEKYSPDEELSDVDQARVDAVLATVEAQLQS